MQPFTSCTISWTHGLLRSTGSSFKFNLHASDYDDPSSSLCHNCMVTSLVSENCQLADTQFFFLFSSFLLPLVLKWKKVCNHADNSQIPGRVLLFSHCFTRQHSQYTRTCFCYNRWQCFIRQHTQNVSRSNQDETHLYLIHGGCARYSCACFDGKNVASSLLPKMLLYSNVL